MCEKINVIFLDIDGVVNIFDAEENHKTYRDEFGHLFKKECVQHLRNIIEKTGAKIVISSIWRLGGLQEMKDMWKKRDLPGEVIGITPRFFVKEGDELHSCPRGFEIKEWFNKAKLINKDLKVDNYVILDDDCDMLYEQRNNFVKCDNSVGINQNVEDQCLEIFGIVVNPHDKLKNILDNIDPEEFAKDVCTDLNERYKKHKAYYGSPEYCIIRSKLITALQKRGCIGDNPYAEKYLFADVTNDEFIDFFNATTHCNEPDPKLDRGCGFPVQTYEDGGIIFEMMFGQGTAYSCVLKD